MRVPTLISCRQHMDSQQCQLYCICYQSYSGLWLCLNAVLTDFWLCMHQSLTVFSCPIALGELSIPPSKLTSLRLIFMENTQIPYEDVFFIHTSYIGPCSGFVSFRMNINADVITLPVVGCCPVQPSRHECYRTSRSGEAVASQELQFCGVC